MTKICTTCKIEKDFNEFYKEKKGKDGLGSKCKECLSLYHKKNHEIKKERHNERTKNYRKNNPEKILDYRERTKEKRKIQVREYKEAHRDEIREYQRSYRKNKRETDPTYYIHVRFSCLMRNHMNKYIKDGKAKSSWVNFVNYNEDDLISYLGEDLFKKGYEIDHIIPVSLYSFKSYTDKEFRKCWDLRNLRVIAKKENISKGNRLNMELIEEYKIYDLLPEGMI